MKELVTDAIVLHLEPSREHDRIVSLYTKSHGRIRARVAGGARILSKFAPHLDPMNLVQVRLTHKNGFTVTDALTHHRFTTTRHTARALSDALRTLALIDAVSPEHEPDAKLWHEIIAGLHAGTLAPHHILLRFGYDAAHAECDACGKISASYFMPRTHTFWCTECSTRIHESALLLISYVA